jgi:hypothetical protein
MDPAEVERELRGLAARVQALEERSASSVAPNPSRDREGAVVVPSTAPPATDFLPALGRSLLALAGAYLLRALVESGTLPAGPGVTIGLLYAVLWLVLAARTPAEHRVEAALHALTSALVLAPLLWEATLRFHTVHDWPAALILLGFTIFGLTISWRKNLLIVATISTIAGLATAAALLVATRDIVPFVTVFLAVAAAVEISACLDHWLSERWLAAAAADLAVLLATYLVTSARGLPEGYAPIPHWWLVAAQVALLAMYLASIIVRTLLRHFQFTAFETMQCIAAFAISVGGGLRLSPAMPVVAVVCGAACYIVAFALLARGRNFHTYATFAVLLLVAGSRILLSGTAAAGAWAALSIAGTWSGRGTLQAHGVVYLLLALAAARDLAHGTAAVVVVGVCLIGARRTILRIPLFLVFAWVFADLAVGVVPETLRLAARLLIYGAALVILPKLRANRAAESEDSGTTPHPRDSAEKSDTASAAG